MMKHLWKPGLGIFIFVTMATNVWGQPYVGGQQQGSTESFMEWAAEQMQQIRGAVASLEMQLENMWSDSRQAGGAQIPATEPGNQPTMGAGNGQTQGGQQGRVAGSGQTGIVNPLYQGSRRGMGGGGICPPGTGGGRAGSARGMGAGLGSISGGALPGQMQNVLSGSGRGQGTSGFTSRGSGRGRGSGGMSSSMNSSGKGRGRRRK